MIDLYKYTDNEIKQILESICIVCDTREKENKHILDVFDKRGIAYVNRCLPCGDYSVEIPKNPELGILKDLDFSNKIIIERKGCLDELAKNYTKERDRLKKEFSIAPKNKVMIIENANYTDLLSGNYKSEYNSKAFWASIHSFWHEFNLPVFFIKDPKYSAAFIYGYFYYYLRGIIK